jgi:hypothetical protein
MLHLVLTKWPTHATVRAANDLHTDLPCSCSEPGYDIGSAPKLSAADRAAAMSWKRPAAGDVGDVETQPLPILQRVGQQGQ